MTCNQVLLNPFIVRVTLRFSVQASQQCVRDEHTQRRYNRSLVDRESRWSAHRWPSELNADCAIAMRYRRSASSFPSPCSLLPRYSKLGTFSSGGSLPMTTLSRHASAARLLLDLTALSVKEPTRDRCVRPPSHHRAMCIFRPRDLVNSRAQDSHLCTRLSLALPKLY